MFYLINLLYKKTYFCIKCLIFAFESFDTMSFIYDWVCFSHIVPENSWSVASTVRCQE